MDNKLTSRKQQLLCVEWLRQKKAEKASSGTSQNRAEWGRTGQNLAEIGQNLAEIGQNVAESGRIWQILAESGRTWQNWAG
jgi:flagellar biosynthesis chaperone FliJ